MGDQAEITALREALKSRTAALKVIAAGPAAGEDAESFAKRAQVAAEAALKGDAQ
jgi:hypothetical protein